MNREGGVRVKSQIERGRESIQPQKLLIMRNVKKQAACMEHV